MPVISLSSFIRAALIYQFRCIVLPAGLSDGLFDLETAACGHSPPSHPTPTNGQTQTDRIQKTYEIKIVFTQYFSMLKNTLLTVCKDGGHDTSQKIEKTRHFSRPLVVS